MSNTWNGLKVYDTDHHFTIDAFSREIKSKNPQKDVLIQNDHNSERFTFEVPRFIEGRDLALCNVVRVYYENGRSTGIYTVTDMDVYPFVNDILTCSWLISQNATKNTGNLSFMLRFMQMNDDGTVEYAWGTKMYDKVKVVDDIDSAEMFETEYVDIIQQWKNGAMDELSDYVETTVKTQVDVAQITTNEENIASLIKNEIDLRNADAALSSRIDKLNSLPSGSTTNDGRLEDICIGSDGTTYESPGTAVREQTIALKDRIELSNIGCEYIPSPFAQGGLNTDGTLTDRKYYASNTEPVEYPYDVKLRINNGYAYNLFKGNGDGTYSPSSETTGETVIPAGTSFLLRIRTDPVVFAAADVNVFSKQAYCESYIGNVANMTVKNDIEINKFRNGNEILKGTFARGSINNGSWAPWINHRVCTPETIMYDRKINIKVKDGFMFAIQTFDDNGTMLLDTSWRYKYSVEPNIPFKVIIRRDPENQNEVADVDEFKSAVYMPTAFKEDILKNRRSPFKRNYICCGKTPLVGHMGLRIPDDVSIPQNSIASYEHAGKSGIWAMEADVHETSDGHFVCIHDSTLDRTTTGSGAVADKTLDEIRKCFLKKDYSEEVTEYVVPTLEEYLTICKMYGTIPLIEIKDIRTYEKFFAVLRKYGFMDTAMLTGGLWRLTSVPSIRDYTDDMLYIVLPTQEDYAEVYNTLKDQHSIGVSLLESNATLTEDIITQMHDAGIFVQVWTVNDVPSARSWFAKGVDAIVTDVLTGITNT